MQRRSRDDRGDDGVASSTQNRMATLLLLAKGREPSWSRLRPQLQPSAPQTLTRPETSHATSSRSAASTVAEAASHQLSPRRIMKVIACLWMISVAIKVLLFPAYHSTDFDVHRHWKAVTLHLPIAEWYYDDKYVTTRHTLDYPPAFALLEYCFAVILSQIQRLIIWFLPVVKASNAVATCLSLQDDTTVESEPPSFLCVALLRSTVVFGSDVVYWIGSGAMAWTVTSTNNDDLSTRYHSAGLVFLLLIGHPALLWLDHIHFQYNGLLLGVLLSSLAALLHANNVSALEQQRDVTKAYDAVACLPFKDINRRNGPTVSSSLQRRPQSLQQQHWCHLFAAALFSVLVSLKHLYVTSCLWYGLYLLRRYCYTDTNIKYTTTPRSTLRFCVWFVARFLALAIVTVSVAAIPMAIFVVAIQKGSNDKKTSVIFGLELNSALAAWITQLWRRLFPFGRGLVHSYWAGNVWAVVVAAHKVIVWIATRTLLKTTDVDGKLLLTHVLQSVQLITPSVTAICMLLAQVPGLSVAWQAAAERSNAKLLQSFAMTSLGTFLFQYHAHEKAVLTALLPGTLWACQMVASSSVSTSHGVVLEAWYIMGEFTAYSLLGIFPLLFQRQEFLLKATSSTVYVALWFALAPRKEVISTNTIQPLKVQRQLRQHQRQQRTSLSRLALAFATMVQLEILTPLGLFGRYEFAPLALTSLVCAGAFIQCFRMMNHFKS